MRGFVEQSVSSIEELSRKMVTPEMRSNTPLREKVSILSKQDDMSRCCCCFKVSILCGQNAIFSLCCFESKHSVETQCIVLLLEQ